MSGDTSAVSFYINIVDNSMKCILQYGCKDSKKK